MNDKDYVKGTILPSTLDNFIKVDELNVPTDGRMHYIRKELKEPIQELFAFFKKDHPDIPLWIRSVYRTYNKQKTSWESKCNKHFKEKKNKNQAVLKTIKYTAPPGASRHHWGTEIDINSKYPEYYKNSEGIIVYNWFLKNAEKFNFFQPYNAGRINGHKEEPWHWSYFPLSSYYLKVWNSFYEKDPSFFINSNFYGENYVKDIIYVYMNTINTKEII